MSIRIISDILPRHIAISASLAIPDSNWQWWHRYSGKDSVKYGNIDPSRIPDACKLALNEIAKEFVPDRDVFPDLDFHAGGMHMIPPGGWLGSHYDSEYHPYKNWKRVGSLVWFANKEWKDEYGGELIVDGIIVKPEFNKAVYFDTDKCLHEVKKVNTEFRKTLALFYWKEVDSIPESSSRMAVFNGR